MHYTYYCITYIFYLQYSSILSVLLNFVPLAVFCICEYTQVFILLISKWSTIEPFVTHINLINDLMWCWFDDIFRPCWSACDLV